MTKRRIPFICSYVDDAMRVARGLRPNAAGSNRALRLATALNRAGLPVALVAPGLQMRMGLRPLTQRASVRRRGRVPVVIGPKLGPPPFAHLLQIVWTIRLLRDDQRLRAQPPVLLLYNYLPTQLATAFCISITTGARVVMDLEDLAYTRPSDLMRPFRDSLLRRWADAFWQSVSFRIIDGAVVPATRMQSHLPAWLPSWVCPASVAVETTDVTPLDDSLHVLWAAPLEREKGIDLFLDALEELERRRPAALGRLTFHVCGSGPRGDAIRDQVAAFRNVRIVFHGYLSNERYRELSRRCSIGLSLQPNSGAEAEGTMPSKVGEFMGAGMMVIASRVGDVALLPQNCVATFERDDPAVIADLLEACARDPDLTRRMARNAHAYASAHFSPDAVGRALVAFIDSDAVTRRRACRAFAPRAQPGRAQ